MMSQYLIYALSDPRTGEIRYVGKSTSGIKRPQQHTSPGRLRVDRSHKGYWVRKLLAEGVSPQIEILEELNCPQALSEAETFWIVQLRGLGFRLTNMSDGGDGAGIGNTLRRGKTDSEETRRRKSEAVKGRKFSTESKLRCSRAQMGNQKAIGNKNRLGKERPLILSEQQISDIVHLYSAGESIVTLGARFDVAPKTIAYWLHKRGVTLRSGGPPGLLSTCKEKVVGLYKAGLSTTQIALQLGVDDEVVRKVLIRAGVSRRSRNIPFRDQYGNVYQTQRSASKQLGLKQSNIWSVLHGKAGHAGGYRFEFIEENRADY